VLNLSTVWDGILLRIPVQEHAIYQWLSHGNVTHVVADVTDRDRSHARTHFER
jgi:hypothetical protein